MVQALCVKTNYDGSQKVLCQIPLSYVQSSRGLIGIVSNRFRCATFFRSLKNREQQMIWVCQIQINVSNLFPYIGAAHAVAIHIDCHKCVDELEQRVKRDKSIRENLIEALYQQN